MTLVKVPIQTIILTDRPPDYLDALIEVQRLCRLWWESQAGISTEFAAPTVLLSWCVLSPAQAARARVDAGVRQAVRAAMEAM